MTRVRLAVVLGAVAVLAVLATVAVAVATYLRDDGSAPASGPLVVRDLGSGARFEVPAERWRVHDPDERISYGDVSVAGPAVLDEGYCRNEPEGSFRAVAGFTDASFGAWVRGVTGGSSISTGTSREQVALDDGTAATYLWTGLMAPAGTSCPASGIEVAMVRAGGVRALIVADSLDEETLTHDDVRRILLSLELP